MALITCAKCSKEYSNTLSSCAHCGYKINYKKCPDCASLNVVSEAICSKCGFDFVGTVRSYPTNAELLAFYNSMAEVLTSDSSNEEKEKAIESLKLIGDFENATNIVKAYQSEKEYDEALKFYEGAEDLESLKKAKSKFLALEDFSDSPAKAEECQGKINEILYAELKDIEPISIVDYKAAIKICDELGDYKDAAEIKAKYEVEYKNSCRKKRNKIIRISAISLVAVAAIAFAIFAYVWLIPYIHYNKAQDAFNNANYSSAISHYEKARGFKDSDEQKVLASKALHYQNATNLWNDKEYAKAKDEFVLAGDYQDASTKVVLSEKAEYYKQGEILYEAGEYESAIAQFEASNSYLDAADKIFECYCAMGDIHYEACEYDEAIEDYISASIYGDAKEKISICYYDKGNKLISEGEVLAGVKALSVVAVSDYKDADDIIYNLGESYIDNEDYEMASSVLKYCKNTDSKNGINYSEAMKLYLNGEYSSALDYYKKAESAYRDTSSKKSECYYFIGMKEFNLGHYSNAKTNFSMIPNDERVSDLYTICCAEENIIDGYFLEALELLEQVPEDFTNENYDLAGRLNMLREGKSMFEYCGTWNNTYFYAETKEVTKFYGTTSHYWYNENDEENPLFTVKLKCKANLDGTYNLEGYVCFYVYTSYYSISSLIDKEIIEKTFKIYDITSMPSSYQINDYTKIIFTENGPRIEYLKTEYYSTTSTHYYTSNFNYYSKK